MNPDAQRSSPQGAPGPDDGDDLRDLQADCARALSALRERVKELDCLYAITRMAQREDIPTPELLRGIAGQVRLSWQYPELACALVRADGREYRTPGYRETPWVQSAPVRVNGETAGLIEVRYLEPCPQADEGPFLREERHLIDAVADLLGQIIRTRRARTQLRRLSGEILRAGENERRRIARELHDKTAQDLSLLKLEIDALRKRDLPTDVQELVGRLLGLTSVIIGDIRGMACALLPPELEQLGLVTAASRLCQEFGERHGLVVDFSAEGLHLIELDFETQISLYRILQEALANVRRHSGAGQVRVRLVASHPSVLMRIEDNGVGFDPDTPPVPGVGRRLGLASMRERARILGGNLTLRSRPGTGTRIMVEVPDRQERDHG